MKNLWNLVTLTWEIILRMTLQQRLILIGSIILPGGLLILIFSQSGRQTIRKLVRKKTTRIFGRFEVSNEDIYKDLFEKYKLKRK